MTNLEKLQQLKSNLLDALLINGMKPNYMIDGQKVSWGEVYDRLAKIDAAIAALQGPIEEVDEGVT